MAESKVAFRGDGGTLVRTTATGSAAMDTTYTVTKLSKFAAIMCKFSAAPTTSESLTVTLDAAAGAAYDVVLYTVDPSVTSITSLLVGNETWGDVFLVPGDKITVAFTNTDTATYGLTIDIEELI